MHTSHRPLRVKGASWLDTSTGDSARRDLFFAEGVVAPDDGSDAETLDASGLTALFGFWDCHAHVGSLMYDPSASGYFENSSQRTIRAGENMRQAVVMGVTGIRCLDEADELDLSWARAYESGSTPGPRVRGAGRALRVTGGHGTAFPRIYTRLDVMTVCDGPDAMARAVRTQIERGAHWIKIMLTGGLYSPHETADGAQLTRSELASAMDVANMRGIPVAAHCGGTQPAIDFSSLGGRSVEHGYMLGEEAAAVMARNGTWLVPTIGVTHDQEYISAEGWPAHAANRSRELMPLHAAALRACIEAGVPIALGADLNPIGPRLHREMVMLESLGLERRWILHAATVGGRELNGFGGSALPEQGAAADVIFVEGDPIERLEVLRYPRFVITHGRLVAADGRICWSER